MNLTAYQPMPNTVPELLYVINADMPHGSARVVAKHNTKVGQTWRTSYPAADAPMSGIRAALALITA